INVKELVQQKFKLTLQQEWLSTGGFILAYLSLASSSYQLPHYLFVAFPLAAIMVAKLLRDFFEGRYTAVYRIIKPTQIVVNALLLIAALMTFVYVFKSSAWTYVVWSVGVVLWLYLMFS